MTISAEKRIDELEQTVALLEKEKEELQNKGMSHDQKKLEDSLNQIEKMLLRVFKERSFDIRFENPTIASNLEKVECEHKMFHGQDKHVRCWKVFATHCGQIIHDPSMGQMEKCDTCPVYTEVMNNPAYRIGEYFNDMMHILQNEHMETEVSFAKSKVLLKKMERQTAELEAHQEELQQTNEELEEQAEMLEEQKEDIKNKNSELESAAQIIESRVQDLEMSNKYKSQFLANMSHELRTPLNSLLLLSRLLMENKEKNLTEKQVEFAGTIHGAGSDLLQLINDILDLSKIEAGKMETNIDQISVDDLILSLERNFKHIAQEKGVDLHVEKAEGLPFYLQSDRQKIEQIIKNLLSNAFKFTAQGKVTVNFRRPVASTNLSRSGLHPSKAIAIDVSDTGIGIPEDKQRLIFEAFQQVDGTTSRNYGGTGLGLSISRELAKLLGGEIHLQSVENQGSTFTIYLPERVGKADPSTPSAPLSRNGDDAVVAHQDTLSVKRHEPQKPPLVKSFELEDIRDDRRNVTPGEKSLLIIEDDPAFAKILYDLAIEKGFKGFIAGDGEAGLHLADYHKPNAIILDVSLPRMDGWAVMKSLRENSETRHIPVHFISVLEKSNEAMEMGAIGYLTKPVSMEKLNNAFKKIEAVISKTMKSLLLVGDEEEKATILELLNKDDIVTTTAKTGREAYELLRDRAFDCMILNHGFQGTIGLEFLEMIRDDKTIPYLPIIIYTDKELTEEEETTLKKYTERIVIKGAKSQERLLDEALLFLHSVESRLPDDRQHLLQMVHDKETILKDKKILLVDDDMRNVFALSNILEENGITIIIGKSGKQALELIESDPEIDLVLMDIMMPEMDGYEAMKKIREQERFKDLPLIALTAKAMRGDRKKCIEAGANDYLPKPVDVDKLLSLLRVWLYQ